MDLNTLTAISPVDGRYFSIAQPLASYFSEFGLMRHRVLAEVEYFIALCELPLPQLKGFPAKKFEELRGLYLRFGEGDARRIKAIESTTNHDVKAIEYFLKEEFDKLKLSDYKEFIHFGLTSQDINNTAIPLLIRDFLREEYLIKLNSVVALLRNHSERWKEVPMLARTHGQPASPTRLGKEMKVFVVRLEKQLELLKAIPHAAKFGGATGNFNAHHVAYPEIDWIQFADLFVGQYLGLTRSHPTTQIEHYDFLAALCDNLKRINTILIDYCRDIWHYISIDYLTQKIKDGEVGSSAMPHKVNPIDFENAEGNLGLANSIFEHLAAKLPISRLQRDLTDSTVLRNIGVPFAHSYVAFHSLERGISKLELNEPALQADLNDNWAVVAEAIQTILRKEGYPNPYEALRDLTRKNEKISKETLVAFIDTLDVKKEVKDRLKSVSPSNYTGL